MKWQNRQKKVSKIVVFFRYKKAWNSTVPRYLWYLP